MADIVATIFGLDRILSVGSVDGICTTAGILRGAPKAEIQFVQAFTVDKVDLASWSVGSRVLFVDLAVNNREPQTTVEFLRRIKTAGHQVVGILDEHNAEDWKSACSEAGVEWDSLAIKPVSQDTGDIKSSGALLLQLLGRMADFYTRELCEAADAGDRMDFTTHFGGLVNQAVKSRIADDNRRVYLAKYFASSYQPDETIKGWIAEYEQILRNHEEIVNAREDLSDGIVKVVTLGRVVDMTTFMSSLYKKGYKVVVVDGEAFSKEAGKKIRQISLGGAPNLKLDLVKELKDAGVKASGFAAKANVDPQDEVVAIEIVRGLLTADQALGG
jgi:hypothetical protein